MENESIKRKRKSNKRKRLQIIKNGEEDGGFNLEMENHENNNRSSPKRSIIKKHKKIQSIISGDISNCKDRNLINSKEDNIIEVMTINTTTSSSSSSSNGKLEMFGMQTIIDSNMSCRDSMPPEIKNYVTISEDRRKLEEFVTPNERFVRPDNGFISPNDKYRCKLCSWSLTGRLFSFSECIDNIKKKLEDLYSRRNKIEALGDFDIYVASNINMNHSYAGSSFLASIKRYYKMMSDFASSDEVFALVATLWNTQLNQKFIKIREIVSDIVNKNIKKSHSSEIKIKKNGNNEEDDFFSEIEKGIKSKMASNNTDIQSGSSSDSDDDESLLNYEDQAEYHFEIIMRAIEKNMPPLLKVSDVEYHMTNCFLDFDLQLKDQFRKCQMFIDHITNNNIFRTIIDAEIEEVVDLNNNSDDGDKKSTASNDKKSDGLKRVNEMDYIEVQKFVALTNQSIKLSAELRARKEKIGYPYSELAFLDSVGEANQMLDPESNINFHSTRDNRNKRGRIMLNKKTLSEKNEIPNYNTEHLKGICSLTDI